MSQISGYNLTIVRIYIAAIVLLLGLTIYVSIEDRRASQNCGEPSALPSHAVVSEETDQEHSAQHAGSPCSRPPSWHHFFAWPDGATAWAIILTLIVLADQTRQTARSTQATERSVALQFRPKLRIRHVSLTGDPLLRYN